MNNPYQAPKAPIEIPPEPPAPTAITWAYVMTGLYFVFAELEIVLQFLNTSEISANAWFFIAMSVLNTVIPWWVFDGIKRRHRLSWLLPTLLVLLTLPSLIPPDDDTVTLLLFGGQLLTMLAVLVILFTPAGKTWRNGVD